MSRALIVLSLILSLAACGDSGARLNPLNWFGGEREQRIRIDPAATETRVVVDGRVLVAEITQLSVEQTTAGEIVRATGVTTSQGYFDAELVPVERTESGVVYEFRAAPPNGAASPGLQQIVAGTTLTVGGLQGVRTITVVSETNQRTVSR